MQQHNDNSGTVFGFILTICFNLFAFISNTWDIPEKVLHCFQLLAYTGAGVSATVTVLNYFDIKWKPFKKKKK